MDALETMIDAYIDCALWADGPDGESWSATDLAPETRSAMRCDCGDFFASFAGAINTIRGLGPDALGHDLWLTRQGHGTGFWDDCHDWQEPWKSKLTDGAREMGHCDLYRGDDGLLYIMGRES